MIRKPLPYDPTPEDRLTRAKWARGMAIFYGSAALLGEFIAAQILAKPKGATGFADAPSVEEQSMQQRAQRTAARPTGDTRVTPACLLSRRKRGSHGAWAYAASTGRIQLFEKARLSRIRASAVQTFIMVRGLQRRERLRLDDFAACILWSERDSHARRGERIKPGALCHQIV